MASQTELHQTSSRFAQELVKEALNNATNAGMHFIFTSTPEEVAINMIQEYPDADCFEPWELIPTIIEWRAKRVH